MGAKRAKPVELDKELCLAAAASCACFNLRKASRAVTQLFDQSLQPSGLRSTQFVLLAMIHIHEPSSPAVLARELLTERTTLLRNLKPLESAGLVQSVPVPGKTTRVVKLTNAGRSRVIAAIPLWEKAQRQFTDRLGEKQWSTMLQGLSAAADAARLS